MADINQDRDQIFGDSALRRQLLLILIGTIVWIGTIHEGYVHLDTPWLVRDNPLLSTGNVFVLDTVFFDLSLGGRMYLGAEYLPLRDLSVLLDFMFFGDKWAFHHLSNFLLYMLSGSLFLAALGRLGGKNWWTWLAAMLFMVHPTHVESVAWLASRKDVLSLALFMTAVWLHLNQKNKVWLTAVVGICAYWSKNTAIALPPILVLISILHKKENPFRINWWLQWVPITLFFSIGLGLTMLVGSEVGMFAQSRGDGFLENFSITAQTWGSYVHMLIFPDNLSVFYVEPEPVSLWSASALLGLSFMLVTILLPIFLWKKSPILSLGLAWIAIGLLPVSQITPIQNLMADRYLLIPSAGLCICMVAAQNLKNTMVKKFLWTGFFVLTVFHAKMTMDRIPVWHDSKALWADLTQKQPKEPRGWTGLAGQQILDKNMKRAEATLQKGLSVLPEHPKLLESLGHLQIKMNEIDKAEKTLRFALKKDPDLRKGGNNLAWILHRKNQLQEALELAEILTQTHPLYTKGWNTLGAIRLDKRDTDGANEAFERALKIEPMNATVLTNLGNVAFVRNQIQLAAKLWTKALSIDPGQKQANEGLKHLLQLEKNQEIQAP